MIISCDDHKLSLHCMLGAALEVVDEKYFGLDVEMRC